MMERMKSLLRMIAYGANDILFTISVLAAMVLLAKVAALWFYTALF